MPYGASRTMNCDVALCDDDCPYPPPLFRLDMYGSGTDRMFGVYLSRVWCRPMTVHICLGVGEEIEFCQDIHFAPGCLMSLRRPPLHFRESMELESILAGKGNIEWSRKVLNPHWRVSEHGEAGR